MKIALFTLEALPNARALRRFVQARASDIVLVGLSNPMRTSAGGMLGQVKRHLLRSGPRILPYLAVNFGLPDLLAPVSGMMRASPSRAEPRPMPLARLCKRLGVPTMVVDDVNGDAVRAALLASRPDLLVTFHFDQILTAETIALAPLGGLNVHPALLPRHRGPAPTVHALLDGDRAFGVTVHTLVPTIDAGAILAQTALPLPQNVSATCAARLLHEAGVPLLDGILDDIAGSGRIPAGKVPPQLPYCRWPDRSALADLRRRKLRLVDRADIMDAATLFLR